MTCINISTWLDYEPYELDAKQKSVVLTEALVELTRWHFAHCDKYRRILNIQRINMESISRLEDVPFIPVRLFKEFDLLSISREDIFKTMTSSGTGGQQTSKIYLDRDTAYRQSKVLSRLMSDILGNKRLPMLIIDSPNVLKNRQAFSARGAGILGFSMFGQDVTYALDEHMNLDLGAIEAFLTKHPEGPIFIFGFTFMIWRYFILPLKEQNIFLPLNKAIILHGGGWKKLQDQAVGNETFREALKSVAGIERVVNYYGMVEQTGSLFIECEVGYLHAPVYADVIVRSFESFQVLPIGEEGIIEVLSMLPASYPGHALLTEDIGVIYGQDDCACGRLGKYFRVNGRVAKAEIRGCSDTHEAHS
jgi:phenylacetate-coenzyme A ligase PaaK-like adenylate-forming protein